VSLVRASSLERALDAAADVRLSARAVVDPDAMRRLRRVERLLRREIGASVPKRRAASLLGISVTALDRWVASGALPVVRRPGGRQEVEAAALLELLTEVRRLREEEGRSHAVVAEALRRLRERGLPRASLRPNAPAAEIRRAYLASEPLDRLREAAELSRAATTLARAGARRVA
jgi:DNA-binding transcriptional MerR regulator